jgi:S-(hydroxymethyl)glutathione dehydrogenase/alcohol dehydrogenase
VDYSFEAIGNKVTAVQALATLRPGGTASIIGAVPGDDTLEFPYSMLREDRRLQSVFMGRTRSRVDIPRYIDLYMQGRLKLDEMIHRYGRLEDVNEAFRDQRAHVGARTVLRFE